ncbi:MAG: oligosaccharide flippase family protein [Acidiferrobacterales bacterium]|nr:oligosaccharide flippase family protein [Acidiferrobacterales bacterium]
MNSNAPVLKGKNVGILAGGTAVSQAFPLLASPILTRIFSPEDFGAFAIYMALTVIIGAVSTLRYEMAIPLAESREKAHMLANIAVSICLAISALVLLIAIFFEGTITKMLGSERLSSVIYLVPLGVFLIGITNVLNALNLRFDFYATVAKTNIVRAVSSVVSQLVLGVLKVGALGLSVGVVLGNLIAVVPLAKAVRFNMLGQQSSTSVKDIIKEYVDFPKYSVLGGVANAGSIHVASVLISSYVSLASAGLYSLVTRTMGAPTLIIGNAIGQVFYQQAGASIRSGENIEPLFVNTLAKLLLLSAIGFGLAYFILEDMFAFVFGEEWRLAGTLATIMIPVFAMRFVTAPLSMVNGLHLENKIGLLANLILLISTVSPIVYAFENDQTLEEGLLLLSFSQFVFYAVYLIFLWSRVRYNDASRLEETSEKSI